MKKHGILGDHGNIVAQALLSDIRDILTVDANFTALNVQRMNKWDKIARFSDEVVERVNNLRCPYTWLVLTEAWCGDAAQIIPFAAKLASESSLIDLKLIWRDENLEYVYW